MLEKDVESWSKKYAKKRGFWVRKFTSPSHRSAPDDLFAKHGRIFFIEFKATGKEPTEAQYDEHEKMRAAGLTVYWTDSREGFQQIFDAEYEKIRWMD